MKAMIPALLCSILICCALQLSCEKDMENLVPEEYLAWESTTDLELNYPIPGHVEQYRRIYINPRGTEVQREQQEGRVHHIYPEGTIIIKDIYTGLAPAPDEKPIKQTVMIKASDHPKSRGSWLWIVKDMKSATETIIDYELCFDCHANANETHPYGDGNLQGEFRDYVFFPYRVE